jgi:hypothetical protein
MNADETPKNALERKAVEWAKRQRKDVSFSLPTRLPDEPPANAAQLTELEKLGVKLEATEAAELGTWQASIAIIRMRQENHEFTQECIQKWSSMQYGKLAGAILFPVAILLAFRGC